MNGIIKEKIRKQKKRVYAKLNRTFAARKKPFLTLSLVNSLLGLEPPEADAVFTGIDYAADVMPGGIALIEKVCISPCEATPPEMCAELADLAISRGAKLLISEVQHKNYPSIVTPEPFKAYAKIAAAIRMSFNVKTIGITGSIGKTSTTGLVSAVLASKYNSLYNLSNANGARYSVKMIQKLKPEHEVYIQEIMEAPPYGTAGLISEIVRPQAAIITVVGSSHIKELGSQERIFETCMTITDGMDENGLLIVNGDDPYLKNAKCKQRRVLYAIDNETADYRAVNIEVGIGKISFDVLHNEITTPVEIHLFGRHNIQNALAAFAVGSWAGMTDSEIAKGLAAFRTAGIRQNIITIGGYNLYIDCYNAAAESMQSSFDTLMTIPLKKGGKRIALLSDIMETGEKEAEIHKNVGYAAASSGLDLLICYGESAAIIAEAAREKASFPVLYSADFEETLKLLLENVTPDDILLLKGSRSMAVERFADRLTGSWYYELDDEAFDTSILKNDKYLKYRIFADHAIVYQRNSIFSDVKIPESIDSVPVTGIAMNSFKRADAIKVLTLSEGLINIRECAFAACCSLRELTTPQSLKIIARSAFEGCKKLQSVRLSDGLKEIGDRAFANCGKLKSIVIPDSVIQIATDSFTGNPDLEIICGSGSFAESYARNNNLKFKTATNK